MSPAAAVKMAEVVAEKSAALPGHRGAFRTGTRRPKGLGRTVDTWSSHEVEAPLLERFFTDGYESGLECQPGNAPLSGDPRLVGAWETGYRQGKDERLVAIRAARTAKSGKGRV